MPPSRYFHADKEKDKDHRHLAGAFIDGIPYPGDVDPADYDRQPAHIKAMVDADPRYMRSKPTKKTETATAPTAPAVTEPTSPPSPPPDTKKEKP